ncbi:hypothetical protein R3P38DRAFT_2771020 [Favolaschia claudopus]|uniref:Uncharacterized protein n=1 Tax=Favolaschia claudopus TaxID=2862362 RepID=A0AAW0CD78_9AGAR
MKRHIHVEGASGSHMASSAQEDSSPTINEKHALFATLLPQVLAGALHLLKPRWETLRLWPFAPGNATHRCRCSALCRARQAPLQDSRRVQRVWLCYKGPSSFRRLSHKNSSWLVQTLGKISVGNPDDGKHLRALSFSRDRSRMESGMMENIWISRWRRAQGVIGGLPMDYGGNRQSQGAVIGYSGVPQSAQESRRRFTPTFMGVIWKQGPRAKQVGEGKNRGQLDLG